MKQALLRLAGVLLFTAVMAISIGGSMLPQRFVGAFEGSADVGKVKNAGSAQYDAEKQEYVLTGSGANMWLDHDEFHWVWKRMKGDFILTASTQFVGKGVEPHRKIGWIIRAGSGPDSPHVAAEEHGDGLTSLQFRRTRGGPTEQVKLTVTGADVIQLERKGGTYTMSAARFGQPFETASISDA